MLGVYASVPVACFRRGMAREYLESEAIPPPSTCYGFLLSLVGEVDRHRHIGVRVTVTAINKPEISVVLRTVWRVKSRPLGSAGNTRPDYQQLLSNVRLVIWLDSSEETGNDENLESRVQMALDPSQRGSISRFGGLSLGESTHLVDEVSQFVADDSQSGNVFLLSNNGRLTLPVWVDHVGSAGTSFATGNLEESRLVPPHSDKIPIIRPKG